MRTLTKRQGMQSGCLDEIAFEQGWVSREELQARAEKFKKNDYGDYLSGLLRD